MRQFAYILACGLVAYLFSSLPLGVFKIPIVIFFSSLGLGLAFATIEERGLDQWIVNFIKAVNSPTQRVWKKEPTIPTAFLYDSLAVLKQEIITLAPTSSRRKLEEFLKYQEENQKVDPLDIPEKESALKVRQYVAEAARAAYPTYPAAAVAVLPELPTEPSTPQPASGQDIEHRASVPAPKESAKPPRPRERPPRAEESITLSPITPDMHSGRRFTSFVPSSGEIILPIRGEKILGIIQNEDSDDSARDKAEKLQTLLNQIKEKEHIAVQAIPQKPTITGSPVHETPVKPVQNPTPPTPKPLLQTEPVITPKPVVVEKPETTEPVYAAMQPLTSRPNVLSGVLKNNGNQPMPNQVIIVRNAEGDPVRAFKTNRLGEFSLATPLINGSYTIEVSKTGNLGDQKFDIISIQAKGEVIPPVEIAGRQN